MGRSRPSGSRTGLANARREAIRAVAKCHGAGIRAKMITGDHVLTARAFAAQIGLESSVEVITMSGRELETAQRASVFARVALEQNLRLVRALQAGGNVVAMIGDGVNDAPALKQVDMGVAMDITGTNVTKEAADMALTDDNFASIEAAVEEGRADATALDQHGHRRVARTHAGVRDEERRPHAASVAIHKNLC
jgi:cation-transporting P-type ATPase F